MTDVRVTSTIIETLVDMYNKRLSVVNLKEICYVWNRMNTTNSVSIVRNDFWDASAWCHIGHQLQLIGQLRHKEMIPILESRIRVCKERANNGIYQQY